MFAELRRLSSIIFHLALAWKRSFSFGGVIYDAETSRIRCWGAIVLLGKVKKVYMGVNPKIGVPQNGWFIMENPIQMDDLGGNTTIFGNTHIVVGL